MCLTHKIVSVFIYNNTVTAATTCRACTNVFQWSSLSSLLHPRGFQIQGWEIRSVYFIVSLRPRRHARPIASQLQADGFHELASAHAASVRSCNSQFTQREQLSELSSCKHRALLTRGITLAWRPPSSEKDTRGRNTNAPIGDGWPPGGGADRCSHWGVSPCSHRVQLNRDTGIRYQQQRGAFGTGRGVFSMSVRGGRRRGRRGVLAQC